MSQITGGLTALMAAASAGLVSLAAQEPPAAQLTSAPPAATAPAPKLAGPPPGFKCDPDPKLQPGDPEGDRIRALCNAANRGDTQAKVKLGEAYRTGRGVKKSPSAARSWYEQAAKDGDAAASRIAGEMAFRGEGGKKDKKRARELWIAAEQAGDAYAPILVADDMFSQITGGKQPVPGKFRFVGSVPVDAVDDTKAWYQAALERDPRPEVKERARMAVYVLDSLGQGGVQAATKTSAK